jgi:hypothetical protein
MTLSKRLHGDGQLSPRPLSEAGATMRSATLGRFEHVTELTDGPKPPK